LGQKNEDKTSELPRVLVPEQAVPHFPNFSVPKFFCLISSARMTCTPTFQPAAAPDEMDLSCRIPLLVLFLSAARGLHFDRSAEANANYESHTRRFLRHTELEAVLWANIGLKMVTFTAIT
jgi:hypothetical protein